MGSTYRYDPRHLNTSAFTTKDKHEAGKNGQASSSTFSSSINSQATLRAQPLTKSARTWQSEGSEVNPNLRHPFIDNNGGWIQSKLPGQVVSSQAQPLTAAGAYTPAGTLRGSLTVEGPKAIAAVHSYNDVSPAVNVETVHDTRGWATRTADSWDATVQRMRTARMESLVDSNTGRPTMGSMDTHTRPPSAPPPTVASVRAAQRPATAAAAAYGDMETRRASVDKFWGRAGTSTKGYALGTRDLVRIGDELGSRQVAGSHNAKLIGSRWRYLERPKVGQPLYTDYYGPCGSDHGNYYGRSYHYAPQGP